MAIAVSLTRRALSSVIITRADNPPVAAALPIAAPPVATTTWVITGKTTRTRSKSTEKTTEMRFKNTDKVTESAKRLERNNGLEELAPWLWSGTNYHNTSPFCPPEDSRSRGGKPSSRDTF